MLSTTTNSHERQNVVIIGAGSAGLATSYFLSEKNIDHVVLERGEVGNTWNVERWDGFHLVNPNWAVRLPGFHYVGEEPEGYLSKRETIDYLQDYAKHFDAPVRAGIEVETLGQRGDAYRLTTSSAPRPPRRRAHPCPSKLCHLCWGPQSACRNPIRCRRDGPAAARAVRT